MLLLRWKRFLLLGVAVCAPLLLLTVLGNQCATWSADHNSHNQAMARIHELGGNSYGIKNCGPPIPSDAGLMTRIHLDETRTGDDDLQFLRGLRRASLIRTLMLGKTKVSDAGLKELVNLTSLDSLSLSETKVSDAGMRHLRNFSELSILDLSGTCIGDAGLLDLQRLPYLRDLNLEGTRVTDAGLVILGKMSSLETLSLARTRITDAGLTHLNSKTRLSALYLDHTQITDAGLIHLKGSRLSFLSLKGTQTGKPEALQDLLGIRTIER